MIYKNAVILSHQFVRSHVSEGSIVVDATMGNGYDTLFLSELVGAKGKVYSFDIQELAIKNTKKLLKNKLNNNNCILIKDNHQNIKKHVTDDIDCAMFNLGYLPGGDKSKTTLVNSTKKAIDQCMDILNIGAIISICLYHGHEQGMDEKRLLEDYLSTLDLKRFTVLWTEFKNGINYPPIHIIIQKIR